MEIRAYRPDDCAALAELFYETVHSVNAADYSPEQLDAWATGSVDEAGWNASFLRHTTRIVEIDGEIVGFADMDESGYLDRLYVHRDHQRKGVARALVDALERTVKAEKTRLMRPSRRAVSLKSAAGAWFGHSRSFGMEWR